MFDRFLGTDDPADAAAGHGVALGHRAYHQGALGHAGQGAGGQVAAMPDLGVIDLVRDQPEIVVPADLREAGQRVLGVDHAGGIVGGVDQQRPGAARGGGDVPCPRLEAVFGRRGDRPRDGAGAAQGAGVGGVVGVDE